VTVSANAINPLSTKEFPLAALTNTALVKQAQRKTYSKLHTNKIHYPISAREESHESTDSQFT
jgi:hypothetical protein